LVRQRRRVSPGSVGISQCEHFRYYAINAVKLSGRAIMAAVTIRNLSDATHRALKVRAALHGRSAEAEMRDILETAVRPDLRLGTARATQRQARPDQ